MASAAAVAANEARSPLGNDIGDDEGLPGQITSGVYSKDDELPGPDGEEDDDDDDDLPTNFGRRTERRNLNAVDDEEEEVVGDAGGADDLFGDEGEDNAEAEAPPRRQLDDEELDSGDDMDRTDRIADEEEPQFIEQEKAVMDLEIPRQPVPEPSDGELYVLKVPDFLSIEPQAWDHMTFQPPTTDHHSTAAPSSTFSAYNTALSTIRWRHSPSEPTKLQSNARVNRWSDGSLTLQLASDPTIQYEIDGNALAPPQRNPIMPTPTSIQTADGRGGRGGGPGEGKYDSRKDAYTYLVRPHEASATLVVTHKITAGLTVKQSASVEDDAIERLQASLAAASNASKVNGGSGGSLHLMQVDEDPEAAKARALEAVRQKEKADKRHQAAMDREAARSNRALGRSGLTSARFSGLNVGMLEDDDMGEGGGRTHASPSKARNPRRRRNSEYSEDEDLGRRRFAKEDEYDEEDDFVARSDEEEEVVEDDDDSDDGIVEERREKLPKRDRPSPPEDDEADAPGEDDEEEEEVQQARAKRRRVIDEEEDEDE